MKTIDRTVVNEITWNEYTLSPRRISKSYFKNSTRKRVKTKFHSKNCKVLFALRFVFNKENDLLNI